MLNIARVLPKAARRVIKSRVLPPIFQSARTLAGTRIAAPAVPRYSVDERETFIGYYDIQPVSPDGKAVLAHAATATARALTASDVADVGYFDRASRQFTPMAQTRLWCWQLGARLRWLPGENRSLAFNTIVDGIPAYCVCSRLEQVTRLVDRPLFDVSADASTGLALNFGRLARARPGYGYPALDDPFKDELLPGKDGVTIVDMVSGKADLVAPLNAIAKLDGDDPAGAFHYLNAGSLSPSGKSFSVLHKRLADISKPMAWTVRAIVGRTDGGGMRSAPLPGAPSHYWWLDDDRIAYTVNGADGPRRSRFVLFDMRDGSVAPLHDGFPGVDGHPSFHAALQRWVTDQYPDFYGEQALYMLDRDGRREEFSRLRADFRYFGEWKCDFHPRWAPDGRSIFIDSTHEGFRAIYEVEAPDPS